MPEQNITYEAIGTSLGVYYLFYLNGEFIESCDESEREETLQRLTTTFITSS